MRPRRAPRALALIALAVAARSVSAAPPSPQQFAQTVRSLEERGAYSQAAERLGELRKLVAADADLDLWWGIDLARAGFADSAARVLASPLLDRALQDTTDITRFRVYGWGHEALLLNGRFDGWYWYVASARAEVAAARGRWGEALEWSRVCTRARPVAGLDWYLRALFAARVGLRDEAEDAAARACRLAPALPEARYLAGVLDWQAGRRAAAQRQFRAAIDVDSSYRAPALALVRARLPVPPDTLPGRLLHGLREAVLLTTNVQPKFDEFEQMESPAEIMQQVPVEIPDSLAARVKPFAAHVVALVDARGRVVIQDDQWSRPGTIPEDLVGLISAALLEWRFKPAIRLQRPVPLWVDLNVPVVRSAAAPRASP